MAESGKTNGHDRNGEDHDFKKLMEEFDQKYVELTEGQKVEAVIISKDDDRFYLDLGGNNEGKVFSKEFIDPESLLAGDKIDVFIKGRSGRFYICSALPAAAASGEGNHDQGRHGRYGEEGDNVTGKISGVNKGGFEIMVEDVRAFCPFSYFERDYGAEPEAMIGKALTFRVVESDPETGKFVLSRKEILEDEKQLKRAQLFDSINENAVYKGTVSSIKSYGVFVDIGGIEGLLHVSEISNERVEDASALFKEGDELEVKVKEIDRERSKISLSRKELLADPWDEFITGHKAGDRIKGVVSALKPYGAFVDLTPGLKGLLHISKLGDNKFHQHPKEVLKSGEEIEVWIEKIDETERKIALTMQEPGEDLSRQIEMIKKEADKKEKAFSGNAFGQLLDEALTEDKKEE